ncbi:DUF3054 domain-containing protein [Nocardioides solisilvae]|uniref:DUF3054 domain-containing protein n=1 Tax=Nocardioides solisilvae TaxID=1542435 RepID=UPI0019527637|nr:DUF3054 domain-containing protein [Nocardioides solisilvae]
MRLPARLPALLLDLVAVLAFAAAGRRSHDSGDGLSAVLDIAWPFAVGALAGHLLLALAPPLRDQSPARVLAGVVVWPVTVTLGMLLRQATGDGTAWSFVLVATGVLGALLVGWRTVLALVRRGAQE